MSRYVVVRYHPVSDNGECVNVGVIAYDGAKVMATFVKHWGRIQRFGHEDITFLREFARDVEHRSSPAADPSVRLTMDSVEEMAARWAQSIQFSAPAGSTLGVEQLLDQVAAHFLPQPKDGAPSLRDRRAAKKVAVEALKEAFVLRGIHHAADYIAKDPVIPGRVKKHKLDFAVHNGVPRDGVIAFSFEGGVNERLMTEVEAAGYAIGDLKEENPGLGLSVVVLEPKVESPEYGVALGVLLGKGARVVPEDEADAWAEEVAGRAAHAPHNGR
jgi:hypothetical protein